MDIDWGRKDWDEGGFPTSGAAAFSAVVGPFHQALKRVLHELGLHQELRPPLVYCCHRALESGAAGGDVEKEFEKFSFHLLYPQVACTSHALGGELVRRVKEEMPVELRRLVDEAVYRPGWMRLPLSCKQYSNGKLSPPF